MSARNSNWLAVIFEPNLNAFITFTLVYRANSAINISSSCHNWQHILMFVHSFNYIFFHFTNHYLCIIIIFHRHNIIHHYYICDTDWNTLFEGHRFLFTHFLSIYDLHVHLKDSIMSKLKTCIVGFDYLIHEHVCHSFNVKFTVHVDFCSFTNFKDILPNLSFWWFSLIQLLKQPFQKLNHFSSNNTGGFMKEVHTVFKNN